MALKAILESLDGLSADVQKEYKKGDDGKFRLDVTAVDGLELAEVSKLQSALSKERENVRTLTDKNKAFDGIDPTKAKDAIKKVEEMATWTPEQKVKEQIDAVKTQLLDAHGKEKAKLEEKLGRLQHHLEGAMITAVATQALSEQKGSVQLLLPHVERQTRLREIDGKFVVEVIGADGNPRLAGTQGVPMTIQQLVEEMKANATYAAAFEGSGAAGGGTPPGSRPKGGTPDLSKMSPTEKLRYARQNKT